MDFLPIFFPKKKSFTHFHNQLISNLMSNARIITFVTVYSHDE